MRPALSWQHACELMLFAEKRQFSETCSDAMKDDLRDRGLIVDGVITDLGKTLLARLVSGELARLLDPVCRCAHTLSEHAITSGKCIIAGCPCVGFLEEKVDA